MQNFKRAEQIVLRFFAGESAHGQHHARAGGDAQPGAQGGHGVLRRRRDQRREVVQHGDVFRAHSMPRQHAGERLAHRYHALGRGQRPAVKLVVEEHLPIRGGVAVVESDPTVPAVKTGEADQEMRFDIVGFQNIGSALL